jgi:hypothetical protein
MEANNDSHKNQTSGDIGIDGIMELDPGPMAKDDHSNRDNPENCDTSTICYDLVASSLVPSDHMVSTFQQGHQAFPLVRLNNSVSNVIGHVYHPLLPIVPIHLDHAFDQTLNLHSHTALIVQLHMTSSSIKHAVINMGDIISTMSLLMTTALQMKILV